MRSRVSPTSTAGSIQTAYSAGTVTGALRCGQSMSFVTPNGTDATEAARESMTATRSVSRRRTDKHLPLWVRALEAHCDYRWPVGAYGHSIAKDVVNEVKRHYEQRERLAKARDLRHLQAEV